jgi:hypothetical protein
LVATFPWHSAPLFFTKLDATSMQTISWYLTTR